MFKRKEPTVEDVKPGIIESKKITRQNSNTIMKGSKLTGDINVSCDLELSGEVEGNINSDQNSNIVIQGTCKGNIRTIGGSVTIEGALNGGDIMAGGDIKVTGKFDGGKAEAQGRISINGEFNGIFEGNDIEVGSKAKGKGEFLYRETISIAKGARIEAQVRQLKEETKAVKKTPEMKVVNMGHAPAK